MNAEKKPEVGDVWLNELGLKCHLFGQIGSYFDMLKFDRRRNYVDLDSQKINLIKWKYIGKSKANITDLFEVKE